MSSIQGFTPQPSVGALNQSAGRFAVAKRSTEVVTFDVEKIEKTLRRIAQSYGDVVGVELITQELLKNIYDGISTRDLERALILATIAFIEKDPAYNRLAAGLFLQKMYREVFNISATDATLNELYQKAFVYNIKHGVELGLLDKRMLEYPLESLAKHLVIERDKLFRYTGLQTLYERYFLKKEQTIIELPQTFWMRVAMGLAIGEPHNKEQRVIEFYNLLSSFRYVASTPTLFHAGTNHPQLSSCYLTYIDDELDHIFKSYKDNANLSKWSGGLGNDWTPLRATGAPIGSIKVTSQGLIPFLKIANDVVAAINRSGSRRGATCAYLEVWHLDYEDFLDLRKNTGDERRRAHDMNTASWIPDLFMKRVLADGKWTLFSPHEVPDLHDLYGQKFEAAYEAYEQKAEAGEIEYFKTMSATQLWRKMLSRLFETGHPWITFKDPCNVRSPQDHVGVVHSSNLCTEITLNTSREETAVCNLGSVNLGLHIVNGKLDTELLRATVKTAVRMLDNVVDINFYPTVEASTANFRHRPIGLGVMGFQDALFKLDYAFEDAQALEFSDSMMEHISYYAIETSTELAAERGAYESFKGSKWDRGLLPIDTIAMLEEERGMKVGVNRTMTMDWEPLREKISTFGMRNSNVMAIAPTATISNIAGCFPCIEPIYKNIYVKSNMSGEFTVVNEYLVADLKKLGLWNQDMLDQLKYYDGSIQMIDAIPHHLKLKYKEAFEIEPETLIALTAVRAKWIDQSQSHNVFLRGVSGKKLSDVYIAAWQAGLKTTYYLRTLGASQIEKSTLDAKKFGFTQKREYNKIEVEAVAQELPSVEAMVCSIEKPEDCEACQ